MENYSGKDSNIGSHYDEENIMVLYTKSLFSTIENGKLTLLN